MTILEFIAKVNQGKIVIPDEYLEILNKAETVQIRVKKNKPKMAKVGMIAELINNPLDSNDGIPLTREETHER
jgi:molybdopterin-biosynthesis enzyme MoeA-like protein